MLCLQVPCSAVVARTRVCVGRRVSLCPLSLCATYHCVLLLSAGGSPVCAGMSSVWMEASAGPPRGPFFFENFSFLKAQCEFPGSGTRRMCRRWQAGRSSVCTHTHRHARTYVHRHRTPRREHCAGTAAREVLAAAHSTTSVSFLRTRSSLACGRVVLSRETCMHTGVPSMGGSRL